MQTISASRAQRGISLIGLLFAGGLFALVLVFAFRTVPVVGEYLAVRKVVDVVAKEGQQGMDNAAMRASFDRRAQINNVTNVTGRDLLITRRAGTVVVEAGWEVRLPIAGGVSLLFEFKAQGLGQ